MFYIYFQINHLELYNKAKHNLHQSLNMPAGQSKLPFSIDSSSSSSKAARNLYSKGHPRQTAITNGILAMVSDCMLPLQLVERSGFKNFMALVDSKYDVPSRRTVTRHIRNSLQSMKDIVVKDVQDLADNGLLVGNIHATIDLWSSRSMLPIIGVRFHYFDAQFELRVRTVAFQHFDGRHTGQNIASAFEDVLTEYGIQSFNFGFQITDNASNMLKAFSLFSLHAITAAEQQCQLQTNISDDDAADNDDESADIEAIQIEGESDMIDYMEFMSSVDTNEQHQASAVMQTREMLPDHSYNFQSTSEDDVEFMEDIVTGSQLSTTGRLSCTAHTLQLVIKDALSRSSDAEKVIKEANSVVVFFKRSLYWCGQLKLVSGDKCLVAAVPTRWNSSYLMLKRLAEEVTWKAVSDTLNRARKEAKGSKNQAAVPRLSVSRMQVLDLLRLLDPFYEATQSLQGDGVTSSLVIPAIMGIDDLLRSYKSQYVEFTSLQPSLRLSLFQRFQAIVNTREYVIATVLDCRYKLVPFPENVVLSTSQEIHTVARGQAIAWFYEALSKCIVPQQGIEPKTVADAVAVINASSVNVEVDRQTPSIFDRYSKPYATAAHESQESEYLNSPTELLTQPQLFWKGKTDEYAKLKVLARRYLSIPASSGSVERLFSASGALMRAHRNRLSPPTVEALLLAKETQFFDQKSLD